MDNDYVVYRYADVLMMKGEALVRQGHADLAVPLFNEVRHRTGLDDYQGFGSDTRREFTTNGAGNLHGKDYVARI